MAPDAPRAGAHRIFVVAHRYHTGLVVRAADVPRDAWPARTDSPDADYLELGWGEREYYTSEDPGVWLGLRALLVPSVSAIEIIAIAGPPASAGHGREFVELRVSPAGFRRLVEFVRQSHQLDADGRGIVLAPAPRQPGLFYASPRTFHAFENCNVWVARSLAAAELPIRPSHALTAGLLLRQVRRLSDEMVLRR